MIAFLQGIMESVTENSLILDVNGVGYELLVPGSLLDRLPGAGQAVKLYTYLQLREDAVTLYGFRTRADLRMFRLLVSVNGVGPRVALGILSAMDTDTLTLAVLAEDAAAIAKVPGIGPKTARKIILELKDRLDLEEAVSRLPETDGDVPQTDGTDVRVQEACEALQALGYGGTEALKAVRAVELSDDMDVERLLKESLRYLL